MNNLPAWSRRSRWDDDGSVAVVMVAVIAVLVALCAVIGTYARAVSDGERARLAADQAALAGASVVLGSAASASDACALAASVAQRNGAVVTQCRELSTGVQVDVSRASTWGFVARATARAGAPQT